MHTHNSVGIDALYEDIRADEADNLENGIGVYIIASGQTNEDLSPQYVGRTQDKFGARLKQHFDKGKFTDLSNDGPLMIFLIARADSGRILTKNEATGKDLLLIEQLEQDLIAHCVRLNKHLLNVHSRSGQKQVYVSGFRGDNPAKREGAAILLAKLLKT